MDQGSLGSKNPFILRNYRFILPADGGSYPIDGSAIANTTDLSLQFKIDGAPVILPYESDVIMRIYAKAGANTGALKYEAGHGTVINNLDGSGAIYPPYRLKLKCLGAALKSARVNLSNFSFYSLNTPQYLNEIVLRKSVRQIMARPDTYTTETCTPSPAGYSLGPAGSVAKSWDNVSFVSPVKTSTGLSQIDFRIPLTDVLPFFKAGVVPVMLTNSRQFDMFLVIRALKDWFVPIVFTHFPKIEVVLSLTTVALPELNPLAELIIKPHLQDDHFVAPYLDYNIFQRDIAVPAAADVGSGKSYDFHFNITQYYRNVPFVSLSFLDTNAPAAEALSAPAAQEDMVAVMKKVWNNKIGLDASARELGGFYTLPAGAVLENVNVKLGPSAFPLTQWPLDNNMALMMNRKHFEMYGRKYNETRVTPNARMWEGDASIFFDLSHGGNGGFQIDSDNPLQVTGTINLNQAVVPVATNIRAILAVWFSNHLVVDTSSGGVYMRQ